MKKKEKTPEKQLFSEVGGMTMAGMGLGIGGTIINTLPATGATAGINAGLNTFGGFFPTFANISGAGYTIKKLKELKKK